MLYSYRLGKYCKGTLQKATNFISMKKLIIKIIWQCIEGIDIYPLKFAVLFTIRSSLNVRRPRQTNVITWCTIIMKLFSGKMFPSLQNIVK